MPPVQWRGVGRGGLDGLCGRQAAAFGGPRPRGILPSMNRMADRTKAGARIKYELRALGREDLPERFELDGLVYRRMVTVKHDFYAVTGFYEDDSGKRVVLKIGRVIPFHGVELKWLGRWLRDKEVRCYRELGDLPAVPKLVGLLGPTGFVHEYVPGRPLAKDRPVPDGFFDQLDALLAKLHARGIAYVDTNKPENILLGNDGRPHLIDFQVSWDRAMLPGPLGRWIMRRLAREDLYHIRKHRRRLRPDELTAEQLKAYERKSWAIRLHRFLSRPYFIIRRRLMAKWKKEGRVLAEGSK